MELCTSRAFSNLRHRTLFNPLASRLCRKTTSVAFKPSPIFRTSSGSLNLINRWSRASVSEGTDQYISEERDGVLVMEDIREPEENVDNKIIPTEVTRTDSQVDDEMQAFEFLDKFNIKLDLEDSYSVLLFGTAGFATLWFASAIIVAIDSIPIFPKLMEVVGLGYTVWFSFRYLIFKKNRDELGVKIEDLKQQVLGSEDD